MVIPWWFALIVWPLVTVILGFTVGYMMAADQPPWRDARLRKLARRKGR